VFTGIGGVGPERQFAGVGNFLGHGRADFLMRNTGAFANGQLDIGEVVNGSAVFTGIGGVGPEWEFKGVGDFLGDGHTGFLIRNNGTVAPGLLAVGEVVNGNLTFAQIGTAGPEWEFVGTGHYLDATPSDFLMRHTGNVAPGILDVGSISNGAANFKTVGAVGPE